VISEIAEQSSSVDVLNIIAKDAKFLSKGEREELRRAADEIAELQKQNAALQTMINERNSSLWAAAIQIDGLQKELAKRGEFQSYGVTINIFGWGR
jgi:hypothetical protein